MYFEIVLRDSGEEHFVVPAQSWPEVELIARRLEAAHPSSDPAYTSIIEHPSRPPGATLLSVQDLVMVLYTQLHSGKLTQRRVFDHFAAPVADLALVYPSIAVVAVRERDPQVVILVGTMDQHEVVIHVEQEPAGGYSALVVEYAGDREVHVQGRYTPGLGWRFDQHHDRP